MTDITGNIAVLHERIAAAASRAGRRPEEISLVAITKTFPPEKVQEAGEAGLRVFGENRVQEAEPKILWSRVEGLDFEWHMVGHLQRNKVKKAIQLFDIVESVDSLRLAQEIDARCRAASVRMPLLLEVNVSGEASKHGFAVYDADGKQMDDFLGAVQQIVAMPNLDPQGLMTVAPFGPPEEELRACFRSLKLLLERLRELFPSTRWRHLSMGMTDDFEVAIEEGSTMIRIGRAIFGERKDH
jgi:pyridoxal phosphate enzyme (YggS family)